MGFKELDSLENFSIPKGIFQGGDSPVAECRPLLVQHVPMMVIRAGIVSDIETQEEISDVVLDLVGVVSQVP